jgi:asparagine synthetase B (glutamine-hydrolysing)
VGAGLNDALQSRARGVALVFQRDGAPVDAADLAAMAAASAAAFLPCGAPVLDPGLPQLGWAGRPDARLGERWLLFFRGRVDNGEELWAALGAPARLAALDDGELVAAALERWGEDALARVLGPFALAWVDRAEQAVTLARDPLGEHGLAFHLDERRLIVASEEIGVLGHPAVGDALDESRLALYFSMEELVDGRTFFREVEQVVPGTLVRVDRAGCRRQVFWRPRPAPPFRRAEEWREAFRAMLAAATGACLRGGERPAVLLSGGLDSTPIAAMARQQRGRLPLGALSWVFPGHPECDERSYIDAAVELYGLQSIQVPGDDAWPLHGLEDGAWPFHPGTPEQNPYRLLHERAYAAAAAAGHDILLSGMLGDQLYSGAPTTWRAAVRDVLPAAWVWQRRRRRRALNAPWLTPQALALLPTSTPWPPWAAAARRPEQVLRIFDPGNSYGLAIEWYYCRRYGVEVRYPLRDRRIVELMTQIPSRIMRGKDEARAILRQSLRKELPQRVLARPGKASLESIFREGVFDRESRVLQRALLAPSASWPGMVRRDVVEQAVGGQQQGFGELLVWLSVSLEIWSAQRRSQGRSSFGDVVAAHL